MTQILSGKKKVFTCWEATPIKVPYPRLITVKLVIAKAQQSPELLKYLPDEPAKHVNREYLFPLVNCFDISFFPRLIEEADKMKKSKVKSGKPE